MAEINEHWRTPKRKYARSGYDSPIDAVLEIIGGKYKVAILYHLRESVVRFGELHRSMPLATKRMLTKQLRELEADGMITRKIFHVWERFDLSRIVRVPNAQCRFAAITAGWAEFKERKDSFLTRALRMDAVLVVKHPGRFEP